jgi:CheY-like chemotaxis protein
MNGKIWLQSEVGRGATFYLTARFGGLENQHQIPTTSSTVGGKKILVVDDNSSNLRILSRMLRPLKAQVVCVESAMEALHQLALAQAANEPYHMLITDTEMPNVNGFQLVEQVRSAQPTTSIPVIMLSAGGRTEVERCQRIESQLCVSKPVRRRELFAAVHLSCENERNYDAASRIVEVQPQRAVTAGLNILLAEDNRVNQMVAKRLLEKRGHMVLVANNGLEAVSMLGQGRFDLVLMDIQMPEMDGITATTCIREMESAKGCHIPIIAMTAHAMKGDRERYLAAGMDGYVSKPFKGPELAEAILDALRAPIIV